MKLSDAIGLEIERREDDYCPYPEECGSGIDGEMCHLPKVKALQARNEALEKAAIDAVQGYEAYAESGFEEVLDPPMMALAALLQEPTK